MNKSIAEYKEKIYAGVLGKIIGVYLGRPVEGWSYEAINSRFGDVDFYLNDKLKIPLVVTDDDISGTFAFFRALEDNHFTKEITSSQIGDTWLNYIIENKTILWWGGLGRSTEHTAYLRLKSGIPAPESGSIALNGWSAAEQIGAQIFIDSWALANPNDPDRAVAMARQAALVSHDGLAVDAACFLAAMESMAFEEKDLQRLISAGLKYVRDERLLRLVNETANQCARSTNWRAARDWIARHHGYDRYPGICPMATNHAAVLMALMMAGDNFQDSIGIATSAGWDTDCNAGNVGCLNGIRLGLAGINNGADLRSPVADRLYVVSSDGGECLSDAVLETRKIIRAAAALRNEPVELPSARYAFDFPGSVQGFTINPDCKIDQAVKEIQNTIEITGLPGLLIRYTSLAKGVRGSLVVNTFLDPQQIREAGSSSYEAIASPCLYPTQTIHAVFKSEQAENPFLQFFIEFDNGSSDVNIIHGKKVRLGKGETRISWQVPNTGGHPIHRLGIELTSDKRLDGEITLVSLDWGGAPENFHMGSTAELSPSLSGWTTSLPWLKSFTSSAQNLAFDYQSTFCISHPGQNGLVTTGTRDWGDYSVKSKITFSQQNAAGLVGRVRGHRRFYAGVIKNGHAVIFKQKDGQRTTLATAPITHAVDEIHTLTFSLKQNVLRLAVDDSPVAEAYDSEYLSGGAGFLVDEGTILAEGFTVRRI